MTSRRNFISGLAVVLTAPITLGAMAKAATRPTKFDGVLPKIRRIEAKSGGRLGVACRISGTSTHFGYRENELFPMCSTFKALAVALILHRVDGGIEQLDRSIKIPHDAVIANSPTTKKHAGGEMTVAQLCEAAVTVSDNGAANLLLESFGGPAQLTAYLRSIGDKVTRLDRIEPELNESLPGDARDTTSPLAMTGNFERLTIGNSLSEKGRVQLVDWLVANKTGAISRFAEMRDRLLPQVAGAPLVAVSAKTGEGLERLLDATTRADAAWNRRVSTATLNRFLEEALQRHATPAISGRRVRIRYMTQAKARPPSFALFGNQLDALPEAYLRYLQNGLREAFDLKGTPLRFITRNSRNPYDPKR